MNGKKITSTFSLISNCKLASSSIIHVSSKPQPFKQDPPIIIKMSPDHLIYLLRNLYAGQEATIRTGHGTTDWFQIGKGDRKSVV